MSPAEVLHRVETAVRRESRRLRARRSVEPAPLLVEARRLACEGPCRPIRVFDCEIAFPGEWPDWSRDYINDTRAPLIFYGDLDYRDERAVGDSKYTWELNRHQFLLPWALEWSEQRDETAAASLVAVVLDWIVGNPRYRGLNWGSSLELGLRVLSWGLAFEIAADAPLVGRARPFVLASVSEQALYIRHTLSAHSSANNHLLGELVGLLAAGVFFPDAETTRDCAVFAAPRFVDEIRRQNFDDGVNREQAVYYHHYVLEYLLVGTRLLERLGIAVPPDLLALARRMLTFVDAMTDETGRAEQVGDADDGTVTGLNIGTGIGPFESQLVAAWVVFGDESCGAHAARIACHHGRAPGIDRSTSYWHGRPDRPLPSPRRPDDRRWVFRRGGHLVQRADDATISFRAGPFGYPSIAAHAHCDQLSVRLRLGDAAVLTDSGTGVYHTDEKWRRYFKGTSAHNTVRVDGRDQAEYGGPFLWCTHASGALRVERDERDDLEAVGTHDGYLRLSDPVTHQRRLRWSRGRGLWVDDVLAGRQEHCFELFWNLGPGLQLSEDPGAAANEPEPGWTAAWRVLSGDRTLCTIVVTCDRPAHAARRCGDRELPAGFESPQYLVFRPVEQLCISAEGSACRFSTRVLPVGVAPVHSPGDR